MEKRFQKILVVDNFDSFTYIMVDYFRVLGCHVKVYRNTVTTEILDKEEFDLLVLSPGPGVPRDAGNMMDIIEHFYQNKPIFGICLGHQALIEFFGGTLKYVEPQHGKADRIINDRKTIFTGLDENIEVARYHSLAADLIPNMLDVSARSQDGTVMGIRHRLLPIEGVQFHPESVLSMKQEAGMNIVRNVVEGRLSVGNRGYFGLMKTLQDNDLLKQEDLENFLKNIVDDQLSEDQKLILLVSLSYKLKEPKNLQNFIKSLMKYSLLKDDKGLGKMGVDICGTGGSGLPRINTSTLTALLMSAVGMPILKHGNKAASGRYGSFNLLENLGLKPEYIQGKHEEVFAKTNLAFIYAPGVHPVVKHFASSRERVATPTVFNVLGPLINPYNPERQFMGTSFKPYMELMLEAAILMGKKQVYVVRAEDGLDEISVSAPTRILAYENGERKEFTLTPEDFGIETIPFTLVQSDNAATNEAIAKSLMEGDIEGHHYKLIAVNAAFIYSKFVKDVPLKEAYAEMVEKIKSGAMGMQFDDYCALINKHGEVKA
jgi:anthranilate synthase/phosphoribosyltransferase